MNYTYGYIYRRSFGDSLTAFRHQQAEYPSVSHFSSVAMGTMFNEEGACCSFVRPEKRGITWNQVLPRLNWLFIQSRNEYSRACVGRQSRASRRTNDNVLATLEMRSRSCSRYPAGNGWSSFFTLDSKTRPWHVVHLTNSAYRPWHRIIIHNRDSPIRFLHRNGLNIVHLRIDN
ncbi:uncharacterized protein LOC143211922 [Lasioglossum baleicum]|uniref:uncharacterized protein LOC143211922 n=1 Tax=Lasioglossum baleicum TaxID=434251 RepID=UPI003FCCCFC6